MHSILKRAALFILAATAIYAAPEVNVQEQSSTPLPAVGPGTTEKLPASLAGTIRQPSGKIAFIREKDIWVMEASGANKMLVCAAKNAEGRLTWSPDGKKIAFTRSGELKLQRPDGTGGFTKLYALFVAFVDSARGNNTFFWNRLTDDFGARDPEWLADGRILVAKNMRGNNADLPKPTYHAVFMDANGGSRELMRQDWQMLPEGIGFMQPTMNAKGDIAFTYMTDLKQVGIAVLSKEKWLSTPGDIGALARKAAGYVGPGWSPDGKWLACAGNSANNSGIYIYTADLGKQYLVFSPPVGQYVNTNPPSFSPDSKWLTFSTTDGSIWICDITGNGSKRISGPGTDSSPAWSKK